MEKNGRIFKSFEYGLKDHQLMGGGLCNCLSWEALKPYLEQATSLRPNEKLIGIIVDEQGITFKFDQKK